jgi:hypothetical protein
MKRRLCLCFAALLLAMFGACAESDISSDDLDLVNGYLAETGAKEMTLRAAEDMNSAVMENAVTGGSRSYWQFLVEYVRNETSGRPVKLSYDVGIDRESISFGLSGDWKRSEPPPEVTRADFDMVNGYLKEAGSQEIKLQDADNLNHFLYEQIKTREIKTEWQLLVDYIKNEQSAQPAELDYSIEFDRDSMTWDMGDREYVGG